jgi:hypothetical protein
MRRRERVRPGAGTRRAWARAEAGLLEFEDRVEWSRRRREGAVGAAAVAAIGEEEEAEWGSGRCFGGARWLCERDSDVGI